MNYYISQYGAYESSYTAICNFAKQHDLCASFCIVDGKSIAVLLNCELKPGDIITLKTERKSHKLTMKRGIPVFNDTVADWRSYRYIELPEGKRKRLMYKCYTLY